MAKILIKNQNGTMFEADESNFRNYEPYGSVIATKSEWEEYCNPSGVVTVEAEEAPKTEEVTEPTPAVEDVKDEVVPTDEVKEKPISRMNRAELVAKLLDVNPHFPAIEDATNDEIRTEIKQALELV